MEKMQNQRYTTETPGPCCQKIDDMIQYARPIIGRWPAFYKYTLGENIMQEMYNMLRLATKARLRYQNKTTLTDLDTSKEILKVFIAQANKTRFTDRNGSPRQLLNDHSYGIWSEQTKEIGALIGGWINSVNNRKK